MLGQNAYGIAQVVLFWGGIIFTCVLLAVVGKSAYCFYVPLIFVWFALWITSLVYIGNGTFVDKNGAPTGGWQ